MKREISDKSNLDKFADQVCAIIEKHVKYIIVFGFVAISHGRFRTTGDIDIIIEKIPFEKFNATHKE